MASEHSHTCTYVSDANLQRLLHGGIVISLHNLLANTGMTQAQAMDALGIEQEERDKYAAMMA